MDEARRFLRYVTPGLLYLTQAGILLALLVPHWTLPRLSEMNSEKGIGIVLATLLASGGVGFVFSTMHHAWHWRRRGTRMDHSQMIKYFVKEKAVVVNQLSKDQGLKKLEGDMITKEHGWLVTTILWHERLGSEDKRIAGAEPRAIALTDLVHSLGTARVASVVASLTAFGSLLLMDLRLSLDFADALRFVAAVTLSVVVFIVQHQNYVRTARLARTVIDGVLHDVVMSSQTRHQQAASEEPPIRVVLSKDK